MTSPSGHLVLLAAKEHDLSTLRELLRVESASVQDAETGATPLHAAITGARDKLDDRLSKGSVSHGDGDKHQITVEDTSQKTVQLLLEKGAIWNDTDENDETPGCLAVRLGLKDLYEIMVDAGVRAELLLNRLDECEALSDGESDEEKPQANGAKEDAGTKQADSAITPEVALRDDTQDSLSEDPLRNTNYLRSSLRFQEDRILDSSDNGVMMQWEAQLMQRHAKLLCPSERLRILNIGFGLGIIDKAFQARNPSEHHIIEAHPTVLQRMKTDGWYDKPGITIHEGQWQEIVPMMFEKGTLFDAVYFDTFAEDYKDFRAFFSENMVGLLGDGGRWGFFNGLGADRQICYDVYRKVVEMDLFEAGFDVEWETIRVPEMDEEWTGMKRRYWHVPEYKLPTCTFLV